MEQDCNAAGSLDQVALEINDKTKKKIFFLSHGHHSIGKQTNSLPECGPARIKVEADASYGIRPTRQFLR